MAVLRVHVPSGRHADDVALRLRALDSGGLLSVTVTDGPGLAALVIDAQSHSVDELATDVVLDDGQPLAAQVDRLWSERIAPFARRIARLTPTPPTPAVLHEHDPRLLAVAQRMLDRIRDGLTRRGLGDGRWTYDHIGSTAVPGLRAKRFIDLQIGAASLPQEGSPVDEVLAAASFRPARGDRPDSPGVYRDRVQDPALAPAEAYRKRLYLRCCSARRFIVRAGQEAVQRSRRGTRLPYAVSASEPRRQARCRGRRTRRLPGSE
jgi:GrpB-like predicted nucleotidyltransferase (UPF0157 family)